MNIRIKKEVFEKHPRLQIAFILIKRMNNSEKLKEAQHLLKESEKLISLTFNKETIKNHYLIQPWVISQQEFGEKARHYHTSVEKLLQKVLRRRSLKTKDTLTNIIRSVAIRHIVPFGIDDLSKIDRGITFDISSGKERKQILKNLNEGDLFYHDSKNILGTKLDYWKSNKTILSNKSANALIHFEALPPISRKELSQLVKETEGLVKAFCGGRVKSFILNSRKSVVKI